MLPPVIISVIKCIYPVSLLYQASTNDIMFGWSRCFTSYISCL